MTGMAGKEVGPQEEMANPQYMKVFAVERHTLPEDFVSFPGTGRDSVFQVCVLLS